MRTLTFIYACLTDGCPEVRGKKEILLREAASNLYEVPRLVCGACMGEPAILETVLKDD
jgi:hypothetical protein